MSTKSNELTIVQRVSELAKQAPSRTALLTSEKKLAEVSAQRVELQAQIRVLCDELRASMTVQGKADEYLKTGKVVDSPQADELRRLRERENVLLEVERNLTRTIQNHRVNYTIEVSAAMKPLRQALVTRAAAALAELKGVADDDEAIIKAAGSVGANTALVGSVAFFHVNGEIHGDTDYVRERRSKGYVV